MISLLLSAVIVVAAASTVGSGASAQTFPDGTWTGELTLPNGPRLAATYVVNTGGDSLSIKMQSLLCISASCGLTEVGVRDDTLSFFWSPGRTPMPCALLRRGDGSFRGACSGARDTIRMTMIPPGSMVPTGVARSALEHSGFDWLPDADDPLHIYVEPDSYAHQHLDTIRRSAEESRTQVLRMLGEEAYPPPIAVFYVDSREKMRELVGFPAGGWTDPYANTVILVTGPSGETADTHEIMHLLAMNLWGVPTAPHDWISEGLAVFATGGYCDYSIERLAAHMYQQNMLIPSDTLITHFRQHDDLIASLQAGSLVQFIRQAHGNDKLQAIWQRGIAHVAEVLGMTFDEVVSDWREHVQEGAARHEPVDWSLVENQCSAGSH